MDRKYFAKCMSAVAGICFTEKRARACELDCEHCRRHGYRSICAVKYHIKSLIVTPYSPLFNTFSFEITLYNRKIESLYDFTCIINQRKLALYDSIIKRSLQEIVLGNIASLIFSQFDSKEWFRFVSATGDLDFRALCMDAQHDIAYRQLIAYIPSVILDDFLGNWYRYYKKHIVHRHLESFCSLLLDNYKHGISVFSLRSISSSFTYEVIRFSNIEFRVDSNVQSAACLLLN